MATANTRPLSLHVSALSAIEFATYPSFLDDLDSGGKKAAAGDWSKRRVDVRELRGWLRGRYAIDGAVIDKVRE